MHFLPFFANFLYFADGVTKFQTNKMILLTTEHVASAKVKKPCSNKQEQCSKLCQLDDENIKGPMDRKNTFIKFATL